MEPHIREAARVTLGHCMALVLALTNQAVLKFILLAEHRRSGKPMKEFNRYTHPGMFLADRAVGNFLEWQSVFLPLFWLNAILCRDQIWLGWIWVVGRTMYPFISKIGLNEKGPKPVQLVATLPSYVLFAYYGIRIYQALFYFTPL
jgi:hypothetical protein